MLRKQFIAILATVFLLGFATITAAQNPSAGRGPGFRGGFAGCQAGYARLNPAAATTIAGTVESVNLGRGMGFPSFTLKQKDGKEVTIVASPYRLLLDAEYEIARGNEMSILVFPSPRYENTFIAVELTNQTTGKSLTLRNAEGYPVGWRVGRGGRGAGGGCCLVDGCPMQGK